MLSAILAKLNNDTWLKSNLKAITGAYASSFPFVRYLYIPLTSDAVKAQSRLELTVVSKDMGTSLEILERIKAVLLTKGDESFDENILEIGLNGGGQLYNEDTKTFHIKAIFTILYKERI